MSDDNQGTIHSASEGALIGLFPPPQPTQLLAAPSTSSELNTAHLRLIPIACFRLEDMLFQFDSSFVLPEVQAEMTSFSNLRKTDPRVMGAPLTIFGHADPSYLGNFDPGNSNTAGPGDDYNKNLSGRRAIAIYAALVRDPAYWNFLYSTPLGGDSWGATEIQIMLDALGQSGSSSFAGSSQGSSSSAQSSRAQDIANDSGQRQQLFLQYMNFLCGDLKLDKSADFLARGAGTDLKGDVQGCSRFNPVMLFSSEDEASFQQAWDNQDQPTLRGERDPRNSINRRVMILVFRKGSQVLPTKWPCPSYKAGVTDCKKRFWSNAQDRRSTHDSGAERKFELTHDTFACRFYQRLSNNSPCHPSGHILAIWLLDDDGQRLPIGTPYRLTIALQVRTGKLRHKGLIIEAALQLADQANLEWGVIQPTQPKANPIDRYLRARVLLDQPNHPFLSDNTAIPDPPQGLYPSRAMIVLDTDHSVVSDLTVIRIRLNNMGYPKLIEAASDIDIFQDDYDYLDQQLQQLELSLRDVHRDGTEMPLEPHTTPDPPPLKLGKDGLPVRQCGRE
jgi:hypothetical protein